MRRNKRSINAGAASETKSSVFVESVLTNVNQDVTSTVKNVRKNITENVTVTVSMHEIAEKAFRNELRVELNLERNRLRKEDSTDAKLLSVLLNDIATLITDALVQEKATIVRIEIPKPSSSPRC